MRQLSIVLMLLLSMAGILQLPGNVSAVGVGGMYRQCAIDDADITPLEFVFEHLLNLEDVVSYFEGEEEEGNHPHQPYQLVQTSSTVACTIPVGLVFALPDCEWYPEQISYPLSAVDFYVSDYYGNIYRPPIA